MRPSRSIFVAVRNSGAVALPEPHGEPTNGANEPGEERYRCAAGSPTRPRCRASGAAGGIASLFPAQPTGFVTDAANLLDAAARSALEARLQHLQDVTGADIAVVTLPTIGDQAASDVALAIGRAWKVGGKAAIGDKRRNAGAVVLVVPRTADHRGAIFISTGQGLEGAIPDARAGQIRDAMIPALSRGDYGAALDTGTSMMADIIARDLGCRTVP